MVDRAVLALGLDVGSTNTKIAAVRIDSRGVHELITRSAPTPADAPALVAVVAAGIRAVVAVAGRPDVVGIASMAESGVALGADDRPLTPIVRWDGATDPDAVRTALGGEDPALLHARTGISASAKVPLVMWAQLGRSRPEDFSRTRSWLGVAELVAFALTAQRVTDHTLAARTMALRRPAALPPRSLVFDEVALARVGLTPTHLAEIVPPDGWADNARTTGDAPGGLPAGIPVVVAGHDHLVAAWGCGARDAGDFVDSLGTSEALVRLVEGAGVPAGSFEQGMSVGIDVSGGLTSLISGSASAGRAVAEVAALAGVPLADVQGSLENGAEDLRPAERLVLPYVAGRQSPAPDPGERLRPASRVRGAVDAGISVPDVEWTTLLPATLDGLALHAAWARRVLDGVAGLPSAPGDIVVASGPAARRPALLLRKAAAFGCAVRTPVVAEPVACSAAVLAAHRAMGAPDHVLPLGAPMRAAPSAEAAYASALDDFIAAATRAPAPAGTEARPTTARERTA